MKRREFITRICVSSAAQPATGGAHSTVPQDSENRGALACRECRGGTVLSALIQGFRDLGYVEGRNVIFEHRYADERYSRFPAQAAELVDLKVDVLIASIKPAALAAQRATNRVPIVFVIVPDPVESKLVASLAKPGANITGLSNMSVELGAKRLQLTKEAIPALSRIALLVNSNDAATASRSVQDNQSAAASLKIDVVPIEVGAPTDLERAFATAIERRTDAVVPVIDSMFFNARERIASLAIAHRLPTMAANLDMVDAGALMAFGPNHATLFRQSAKLADRILKGQPAGDIPVEQPTQFELRINLRTAKAIGIELPKALLARADKVID